MTPSGRSGTVLVNDLCALRGKAGIAKYLENLLRHWPRGAELLPTGYCAERGGVLNRTLGRARRGRRTLAFRSLKDIVPAGGRAPRMPYWLRKAAQRGYATAFRAAFARGGYAACFEPSNVPVPTRGPTVTTVHDLSVLERPQWHPGDRVAWWSASLAEGLAATRHWITPSAFTRDRMRTLLGLAESRITVIPLAGRFLRYPSAGEVRRAKAGGALPPKYFLHLEAVEPRKNLPVLLDAYATLPGPLRQECKLVVAGPAGWGERSFWQRLARHAVSADVLATGYVPDADVALLLAGATALLAPSRYEGFGLPVLEAMSCGTPVICSTAAVFREVTGPAAEAVDPDDVAGWAAAMRDALAEPPRMQAMASAGRVRSERFSWQATAAAHVAVFSRVAAGQC